MASRYPSRYSQRRSAGRTDRDVRDDKAAIRIWQDATASLASAAASAAASSAAITSAAVAGANAVAVARPARRRPSRLH